MRYCAKIKVIFVSLCLLFSCFENILIAQSTNATSLNSYNVINYGVGNIALLKGYPNSYWVVTSNSVSYAMENLFSKFALSLNAAETKPRDYIKKSNLKTNVFWSDHFDLDKSSLGKMGLKLGDILPDSVDSVKYRGQIVGAWWVDYSWEPELQGYGQRSVRFELAFLLEKKALKSDFVPVVDSYNPSPVNNWFVREISKILDDCPRTKRALQPIQPSNGMRYNPCTMEVE